MGTYNGEKFIREQLDSILAQTYPIKEIIIQDDGSTDGTIAICEEYAEKYPNIHFSCNEHNLGFNLNFKCAAMKATGDYVAISDQDDVWFPEKIASKWLLLVTMTYVSPLICGDQTCHTRILSVRSILWKPCSFAVLQDTPCSSDVTSSRRKNTG